MRSLPGTGRTARAYSHSVGAGAARGAKALATGDPFGGLVWPRGVLYESDPSTPRPSATRCVYVRLKHPDSHPLVYTLFRTGLRIGEVAGLLATEQPLATNTWKRCRP
jgi:hypothetical protein